MLARPASGADDPSPDALIQGPRTPVPRAVGIADTGDGEEALRFARDLAAALAALGATPHLALTAHAQAPVLAGALQEALAQLADVSLHALSGEHDVRALPAGRPLLIVGVPALTLCAPGLSVLLGGQRAPARWPAALRALREEVDLAIAAPRPQLPSVLAATLVADGLLLRGGDGVR